MAVTELQAAIERARKAYADFDAGNVEGVSQVIADDVIWHIAGTSRYAGTYRGKQAVFELFGRLMQDGVVQQHDIHDILASEDHVAVLATVNATYNGRSAAVQVVDIHHENDAGQTTEFWRISNDTEKFDELLSS